jgi:hypothetical protein
VLVPLPSFLIEGLMYTVYFFLVHVGAEVVFVIDSCLSVSHGNGMSFEIRSLPSLAKWFSFRQYLQVTPFELGKLPFLLDEVLS